MPIPPPEITSRFDAANPSYASYPTADRFVGAFTAEQVSQALAQRQHQVAAMLLPLSVYVHVAFCKSVCHHCAGRASHSSSYARSQTYLRYLTRETDLHTRYWGMGQRICQVHLGGASLTMLCDDELRELMNMLHDGFNFAPDGEYTVEVDPRTVTASQLNTLAELGFNRLTLDVQDFDPAVQQGVHCVHRVQPVEQLLSLVQSARLFGFESVNVKIMFGLPQQTPESFDRTLDQITGLQPDRIALYAFTHLHQQPKSQRRIVLTELPSEGERRLMLSRSLLAFQKAGYVHVGMDYFALPADSLAIAKRQGRLHRNFLGYSAQPDCDLISLGVSAVGRIGASYSQNAQTLDAYYNCLDQGRLPVERGLALTRDDLVRRSVIMALICQGQLEFESIDLAHLINFKSYFSAELTLLQDMQAEGLVEVSDTDLQITAIGWHFARSVAAVFDRYLQADHTRKKFSRII